LANAADTIAISAPRELSLKLEGFMPVLLVFR
jgi:hypothetical protein